MSFDNTTEAAARWLARPHSRRRALGVFAGAAAAFGLGSVGLADRASADSGTFTLVNQTGVTIWPGIAGNSVPNGGGFELAAGASTTVSVPSNWSGRIWARTNCDAGGTSCETGDCGALACNGASGQANVTLAEFTLGAGGSDYYDVSLVDAFNLPMTITPQGGDGCSTAGCSANLLPNCPSGLQDKDSSGNVVACLSACSVFGGDEACCTGAASAVGACNPSAAPIDSASYFKSGCPNAYSYANDTVTSTFACSGASGYVITFYSAGGGGTSSGPAPVAAAAAPSPSPSPDPASPSPAPTSPSTAAAPAPAPSTPEGPIDGGPWGSGLWPRRQGR